MTYAEAASAPALDPTMLALLSIFGGAALTIIAGFIGAGIQARREHRAWLREKRYDAFVRFMNHQNALQVVRLEAKNIESQIDAAETDLQRKQAKARLADIRERTFALGRGISEAGTPVMILGDKAVEDAVGAYLRADADNGYVGDKATLSAVVKAMKQSLKIKD